MMDDEQLGSIISGEITDALNHYDQEFSAKRIKALDYYLAEPLGNEVEGKSQVISQEFADTVEQIMPSLMRIFTASDKYVRFAARTAEDEPRAEQASDYVNYIINHDNPGFRIFSHWFRDALMFGLGAVKFYYDDTTTVEEATYENLSEGEIALLLANPDVELVSQRENMTTIIGEDGEDVEVVESYNLKIRVKKVSGKICIDNIPPEEFMFNKRAKSLEDARFICHRTTMTISDLVSMGYDQDEIEAHAGHPALEVDEERQVRFGDIEGGTETMAADPSQREISVYDSIILCDMDEDGVAERRRVLSIGDSGQHILENEVTDFVPFAVISPIMMPHRLVGRSIFDLTEDLQVIKSTLMRQYLDATYLTVNPRTIAVEGMVNLDDLLDGTAGGIVRVRQPGAVQTLSGQGVGGEVQPLMRYLDEVKESRTGMSKASQGLDANALQSTTASAVSATVRGAQAKLESYARTFAETGVKDLFRGILKLVAEYQQQERIVRLRNQFVPIDPREFDSEFDVIVNVGLGTADDEQKIAFIQAMMAEGKTILGQLGPDNPLCGLPQYAAMLQEIVEIGGFKDTGRFFNPPQVVAQQVAAKQQQDQQMSQNPEMIKVQQEFELKKAKMEQEIALAREKMQADLELRRQELILEAQLRQQEAQMGANISTNLPRA
jgi:hypothetical protein